MWYTLLILVLRRQRQVYLCEFKITLIYTMSSTSVRTTYIVRSHIKKKNHSKKGDRFINHKAHIYITFF